MDVRVLGFGGSIDETRMGIATVFMKGTRSKLAVGFAFE